MQHQLDFAAKSFHTFLVWTLLVHLQDRRQGLVASAVVAECAGRMINNLASSQIQQ